MRADFHDWQDVPGPFTGKNPDRRHQPGCYERLVPEPPAGQTKKPPIEAAFSIAAAHQAAIDPEPPYRLPSCCAYGTEKADTLNPAP